MKIKKYAGGFLYFVNENGMHAIGRDKNNLRWHEFIRPGIVLYRNKCYYVIDEFSEGKSYIAQHDGVEEILIGPYVGIEPIKLESNSFMRENNFDTSVLRWIFPVEDHFFYVVNSREGLKIYYTNNFNPKAISLTQNFDDIEICGYKQNSLYFKGKTNGKWALFRIENLRRQIRLSDWYDSIQTLSFDLYTPSKLKERRNPGNDLTLLANLTTRPVKRWLEFYKVRSEEDSLETLILGYDFIEERLWRAKCIKPFTRDGKYVLLKDKLFCKIDGEYAEVDLLGRKAYYLFSPWERQYRRQEFVGFITYDFPHYTKLKRIIKVIVSTPDAPPPQGVLFFKGNKYIAKEFKEVSIIFTPKDFYLKTGIEVREQYHNSLFEISSKNIYLNKFLRKFLGTTILTIPTKNSFKKIRIELPTQIFK